MDLDISINTFAFFKEESIGTFHEEILNMILPTNFA